MRAATRTKRYSGNRGTALVEFAVVLPLLMVLMLGGVDLSRAWRHSSAVGQAAHAGAQYGAQTTSHTVDTSGIYDTVVNGLDSSIASAESFSVTSERYCECENSVSVDCDSGECFTGGVHMYVRVRVNSSFETMFDYPGMPTEIDVSREARMRAR